MTNPQRRSDHGTRIDDLERRLRILERASRLNSASIGEGGLRVYDGGSITVQRDGELKVVDDDGDTVAGIGYLGGQSEAYGITAFDPDGNRVMFAGDPAGNDLSTFAVWDEQQNPVVRTDPGGVGLTSPRAAVPVYAWRDGLGNERHPSITQGGGFLLLASGRFTPHWPVIEWSLITRLSAGATSSLRVEVQYPIEGASLQKTESFSQTSFTWTDSLDISSLIENFQGPVGVVNVWARKNSGAAGDGVGATILGIYGKGTE